MNWFGRILMLIAVVLAVIASFVKFKFDSVILVALGLLAGFFSLKLKDLHSYVIAALGLALGATILMYFGDITAILGSFLTALFGNLLKVVSAAVLALVIRYLIKHVISK